MATFHGRHYSVPDGRSFAYSYREFFQREILRFETESKEPFILDCGANYGLFTAYVKKRFKDARVVGFEPDPVAFNALQHNCGALPNVTLKNAAVWNAQTTLPFVAVGADGGHLAKVTPAGSSNSGPQTPSVATVRLRDYLVRRVDFLKIDIEGAEFEVLSDCCDRLCNVEKLFVEYHSFIHDVQRLGRFFSILEEAGFRIHAHSSSRSPRPFEHLAIHNNKDMRLNVFCWRKP